jgi:hypothetical protein
VHRLFFILAITGAIPAAAADADWYTCNQNSDCVVVLEGRCGVEWAANKHFEQQSKEAPPRPDMPCSEPMEWHPANTIAVCKNMKCVLSPPGSHAGGYPMPEE